MIRVTLFSVALAVCAHATAVDDKELQRLVADDLANEYAQCGAYFVVNAEGMRRSMREGAERDKEVTDWMRLSSRAFGISMNLGSQEKTKAVAKLANEKIKRMMSASYENWSIAAAEYAYLCKDLMDEPAKRAQYWMDQERRNAPP